MKSLLTVFLALWLTQKSSGQIPPPSDSIPLKVTKMRSGADRTYYWLKDEDGNKYRTVCSCLERHLKGDIVLVSKKDLELFIQTKN